MNRHVSWHLLLLLAWCIFSTCGLLMVVTAEPSVLAWIVTPEAGPKEGGQVHMRCLATNLQSDHIVEWRTEDPVVTLRWGTRTVTANLRFMYETTQTGNAETTQDLNIVDLQRSDTDEYVCNVREPILTGGYSIVASARVALSVLYFPDESFPICSPNGPIAEDSGKELNLQCSSDSGNSAVVIDVLGNSKTCRMYLWTQSSLNNTLWRSLNLTVDAADNDVVFQCVISSPVYDGMRHSCTIGPITVTDVAGSVATCPPDPEITTQTSTATSATLATISSNTTAVSSNTAVIAGASAGGAAAFVLILVLIVVCRRRGLCRNTPSPSKSNVKPNSNQTDGKFTTCYSDRSQPHVYDNEVLEAQNSQIYACESHQELNQVMTANFEPEPTTSLPGTAPVTSTVESNNAPLYAKPHKGNVTHRNDNEAKLQHMSQSLDATMEQRYSNPVFDSDDSHDTRKPLENRSAASLKPVAMVPPINKVPAKPKPYKPKAQRASTPQDNNANQGDGPMSPRPQSTPSALPTNLNSATPSVPTAYSHNSGIKTSSTSAHENAPYALVSGPENRSDSDNHIVYAELDLQSIPSEDGDQPLSSVEPVVYASVMN